MLHENDVVRLKHNIPANSPTEWPGIPSTALDAGTIGSVVMVYTTDSVNYEYEVEFVDSNGHTLALLTLKENDIEPVDSSSSHCKERQKMYISPKASAIIQELLAHHGISIYEIEAIPEGDELPGSTYPGELTSMSGYVITPTTVYEFWFDWEDGHYTLGEEDGSWQEAKDQTEREAKITCEIQKRLYERLVDTH